MESAELIKLVEHIQKIQTETPGIEVKASEVSCPTRLYDTLSAFSNQDSGGVIVFGLDEHKGFSVVGVYDPADLQKKVTGQCNEMQPPVRPLFSFAEINGKTVVSAEIPGVDYSERPVFYRGVGRNKGSYIRVGDSDEHMTELEIYSYISFVKHNHDDARPVANADFSMLKESLLETFLNRVKTDRPNLSKNVSDEQIFKLYSIDVEGHPSLGALLAFGLYPQSLFPQLCLTAVVVPGLHMGDTGESGERFMDNERINGSIGDIVKEAVNFVARNCRRMTIIDEKGERNDRLEYPLTAIREAVLNALIHRDYSSFSENIPVTLEMYRDRIEIRNPGGLFGRSTIEDLGTTRPLSRNAMLINMLEPISVSENRYSGIPTIRKEIKEAGGKPPAFISHNGEFKVIIYSPMVAKADGSDDQPDDLTKRFYDILEFCLTPRSREELMQFTHFSRYYLMDKIINPLLKAGLLAMTRPDAPKSRYQKYYKV